ncbi:MAG: CpaF family protein [Acidimicrobiales bacterium]
MSALADAVHRRILDAHPSSVDLSDPVVVTALVRSQDPLASAAAVEAAAATVRARMRGLGPLDPLLADPTVSDVLVNGPGPVWVERAGKLERTEVYLDRAAIDLLAERIVAPLGRRVDPSSPMVDGRLADGSRVHIVVPPLAIDGPCLAIRRFAAQPVPLADFAAPAVVALLRWAVRSRANLLVVGGTGSGKTTLLNALGQEIPDGERVITVEDAAELRLASDHVVRLESRPPSADGATEVTCRDLVRNALRMRPDRLVVGEVRGPEALDMVAAMNTGHDGSLSTLHANGCEDALRRLETLVLLAGSGLPLDAVRDHLAAAVDLVVHVVRGADGGRRVSKIAEVVPGPERRPGEPGTRTVTDGDQVVGSLGRAARHVGAGLPPGVGP